MHEMSAGDEQAAGLPRARHPIPSNDGHLIGTLPPELSVQVLENVYWLLERIGIIKSDTNWTVPYQLVCRRWQDVICSTPQLWQDISVSSSPKWLEFCLTRCAGAPATVHVWHPTSPDAVFATLCRHASCIRACYVHCDVAYMWYLEGLPSLLAMPMPALEALSINGPYREDQILDVPFTHNLVPRLASLELWNCIAPRDVAVYASLRTLTFLGTTWTISYDEFLDIMRKCTVLEYLRLDEEILDMFAEEITTSSASDNLCRKGPLVLPRLKVVNLSGQREVLFQLLATIHAPQATTVELTNCLDDDEPGPLVTRLLAPDPQQRFPFLSAPCAISLSCWVGDPFEFSLRGGPDGTSSFSADYGIFNHEFWPGNAYLEHNLLAIIDFFSVASVDTLVIEGCLGEVAAETWQRVFEAFQNLRELHIKGRGALDTLWLGLSRASTSSLERGQAVCCPSLSEIVVDDLPWRISQGYTFDATATLFGIVRGALRARAEAGTRRLKRLQLHLEYTDELWSQTSELREAFVEDVKALVDELVYRDGRT